MEVFMKNELFISSLILLSQISPEAMAQPVIQQELAKGIHTSEFKTPLFITNNPFDSETRLEMYAVIKVEKDKFEMNDINMAKISHKITFEFFDRNGKAIKGFNLVQSDEGGFFAELSGSLKGEKTYTLWSCSSTLNCASTQPAFLHYYELENGIYSYSLTVTVADENYGNEVRQYINFDMPTKIIK